MQFTDLRAQSLTDSQKILLHSRADLLNSTLKKVKQLINHHKMTPRTGETAAATSSDEENKGTSAENAGKSELTPVGGEKSELESLPLHLQAAVARKLARLDDGITLEQALSCTARPASKPQRPSPSEVKIPRHLEMSGMSREQILKCMGY